MASKKKTSKLAMLTEQQKEDFARIFCQFDQDGSGNIDRKEMRSLLNAFGFKHLTKEDLDAILAKIDKDLSGTVSRDEFMEFMAGQTAALDKEVSTSIFDIIDDDNDGHIDLDEFTHVVRTLNPDVKDADLLRMFKMADLSGEGTVTRDEFKVALESASCSIWRDLGLSIATVAVISEVVEQYSRLAKNPEKGFGTLHALPYGKSNAERLGYKVADFPDALWESACQCANVFSLVPASELDGATVVEFGSGSGADLCVAARLVGEKGRVYGIDMNRPMVKKANTNLANCGLADRASAHVAIFDSPSLPPPLQEGEADFVIVNGTINLSPRKGNAFLNAVRALKKGGRLLLADVVLKEGMVPPSGKGAWCDCVAGAVPIQKLTALMEEAGFNDVTHVGYSDYLTSDATPTATFTATKA